MIPACCGPTGCHLSGQEVCNRDCDCSCCSDDFDADELGLDPEEDFDA